MAERGVMLTDETVRQWCQQFGQRDANEMKRRHGKRGDTWHLDEVFLLYQQEDPLPVAGR